MAARLLTGVVFAWLPAAAGASEYGHVPDHMTALVATSSSNRSVQDWEVPKLGDLRRKFEGLPRSCEVLLQISASSVNPADRSVSGPFPQVMGSDLSATVVAAEANCTRLKIGDRVWADIGAVVNCSSGKGKENGAYAQYAVALETQLGLMPRNLGVEEAAALPKVSLTSYKALRWYGGAPYTGRQASVLILGGSGGTGSVGIQLAKAWGANTVITTTSAANTDYVRSLGADLVIDYKTSNWTTVIADESVDVIYDTVGQKGTGDAAMAKLVKGGHYVTIVGAVPTKPRADVTSTMFINSNTNLDNFQILDELRALVEQDKLRMRDITTYSLLDILKAFDESASGHVRGKLVITAPASLPSARDAVEMV
eukprot:TRINITY_DN24319_c0_g1_i1.p1 TRINITY_DN24319_c0_g1~~TRINITY_DN24319_c0_g1_i1.p1  ORF type:complete len:369 (+),score=58.99 TRINITY_DN24319_c0_g1_i1:74-1180(+)